MSDQHEIVVLPSDGRQHPGPPNLPPTAEDATAVAADPLRAAEDMRRLEAIDAELAGVDAALRRLDEGSYGTCEVCAAALTPDTVARDPLAVRCPDHGGEALKRPVAVLAGHDALPFGRQHA